MKTVLVYALLSLSCIGFGQSEGKDSIRVFFLGGQSNMVGRGNNIDLPSSLKKTFSDVWIFNGNLTERSSKSGELGTWENLKPGHGAGIKKFGVELSFAKKLQELYPNEKIALIKYARGGTAIDSMANRKSGYWEPDYKGKQGVKNYDLFLKTVKSAFNEEDINDDGRDDYLIPSGIIWMQGESDGNDEEVASRYYFNLKRLMDLFRATFRDNYLPVVIGKISDSGNDEDGKVWDYCELVQYAQEKYVKLDDNAIIVRSTKNYNYSDPWHYDSKAYIDLGERFAEAVYHLNNLK
ncbi:sialate O-acetylesterase [Cellulophaga sp. L1A9]|uniref:sialate O-acetylesterase n=1 Tax=Cellulophaga sp. L1A9 TaxID=2686362 RepID=UPI00131B746E|nr:sialate O-acetylesterase [Cellulophaga sp. L1A9]